MKLFDPAFDALERKLDIHLKRHAVLSGNVANNDTPNYRAREVNFAGELEKAMGEENKSLTKTNSTHMDLTRETSDHVVFDNSGAMGSDGNNVDLDIAMGKLSQNSREYSGAINLLTVKLRMLRAAASGGRGGF